MRACVDPRSSPCVGRTWTSAAGEDYTDLGELYFELVSQWNRYVNHVLTMVGGIYETLKSADQDGWVYEPVAAEDQRTAVAFLVAQVLKTPTWLNDPEILRRIEHAGGVDRVRRRQVALLNNLLEPGRMQRLVEPGLYEGDGAYMLIELMVDVKVSQSDIRPLARAQLREIGTEARRAMGRTSDRMTRAHLEDIAERIDAILESDR